jgi:thiamine kinase-like enzyme
MSPAEFAAEALGRSIDGVQLVEEIKHGLTNESWRVKLDGQYVIVRISRADESALQIDRASEAVILQAVARAKIGADVLLCDPARHVLVTRDLGATWNEADPTLHSNAVRLAYLIRRLHELPTPHGTREVNLINAMRGYLRTLDEHGKTPAPAMPQLRQRGEEVGQTLAIDTRPCLCHNDIHHLNIVDGAELRLIDWEYAGVGEPMFDLASVCVYHSLSREQRADLLRAYAVNPLYAQWHRLELACWLFEYIRELWMEVRALV